MYQLVEMTPDGPVTIAWVTSLEWAVKLVALLTALLGDEGRSFAFVDEGVTLER